MPDNFLADLDFGEKGEYLVKELASGNGKFEVKRDRMSSTTGNIAIEIECNGKPSGITATEADWFVYVLSGKNYNDEIILYFKTTRLRKLVAEVQAEKGYVMGGDGKRSKMVLVPITRLLQKEVK